MKQILLFFISIFLFSSCAVKPEPIQFGKDACQHCKMILMDNKFGSELVTTKGKVLKFDDVNCLLYYMKEYEITEAQLAHMLIIDFNSPETLIDLKQSHYLKAGEIKSPMASNIAAFADVEIRNQYLQQWEGSEALNWMEINKLFNKNQH
jgi:copper chaperone NosL